MGIEIDTLNLIYASRFHVIALPNSGKGGRSYLTKGIFKDGSRIMSLLMQINKTLFFTSGVKGLGGQLSAHTVR